MHRNSWSDMCRHDRTCRPSKRQQIERRDDDGSDAHDSCHVMKRARPFIPEILGDIGHRLQEPIERQGDLNQFRPRVIGRMEFRLMPQCCPNSRGSALQLLIRSVMVLLADEK